MSMVKQLSVGWLDHYGVVITLGEGATMITSLSSILLDLGQSVLLWWSVN